MRWTANIVEIHFISSDISVFYIEINLSSFNGNLRTLLYNFGCNIDTFTSFLIFCSIWDITAIDFSLISKNNFNNIFNFNNVMKFVEKKIKENFQTKSNILTIFGIDEAQKFKDKLSYQNFNNIVNFLMIKVQQLYMENFYFLFLMNGIPHSELIFDILTDFGVEHFIDCMIPLDFENLIEILLESIGKINLKFLFKETLNISLILLESILTRNIADRIPKIILDYINKKIDKNSLKENELKFKQIYEIIKKKLNENFENDIEKKKGKDYLDKLKLQILDLEFEIFLGMKESQIPLSKKENFILLKNEGLIYESPVNNYYTSFYFFDILCKDIWSKLDIKYKIDFDTLKNSKDQDALGKNNENIDVCHSLIQLYYHFSILGKNEISQQELFPYSWLYDENLKNKKFSLTNRSDLKYYIVSFDDQFCIVEKDLSVNKQNLQKILKEYPDYCIFHFEKKNHTKVDYLIKIGKNLFFVQNTITKTLSNDKNRFYYITEKDWAEKMYCYKYY
jgi:hypothetical protein